MVVALVALVALVASSATSLADTASAEASFERGRSLLKAGNTREACAAFQLSLDDDFQYGTLYNLAGCQHRLGNLASAWRMYTRLASEDTNPGRRDRSRELAQQLWQAVPKLIVEAGARPPELAVRLDGEDIVAKLQQPIPVDPGTHVVLATAPGFREWRTTAKVEAASAELRVAVELEPVDAPVREPAQPRVVEYRRHRVGHRKAAIALLVAGPIGWGVTAGFALYEKSKYDAALRRIDAGGPGTIEANTDAANRALRTSRIVGTSLFVASTICIGAGLVLYVQSKTVVLTPIATANSGGIGLSGSF